MHPAGRPNARWRIARIFPGWHAGETAPGDRAAMNERDWRSRGIEKSSPNPSGTSGTIAATVDAAPGGGKRSWI